MRPQRCLLFFTSNGNILIENFGFKKISLGRVLNNSCPEASEASLKELTRNFLRRRGIARDSQVEAVAAPEHVFYVA